MDIKQDQNPNFVADKDVRQIMDYIDLFFEPEPEPGAAKIERNN
jgi:hypothetical protein